MCANAACSARVCATGDCARCRFDANGDGTCEGAIQSGQDDAENSCGATACDGAGGRTSMVGAPCSGDSACVSNACGCDKADCPQRVCIPNTCPPCTYWNGTVCVYLSAGSEHPGSCVGTSACREGACVVGKSNGEACAADAECVATICAPRSAAAGSNTCGRGIGLCDSDVDCHVPGCSWDCNVCKVATRECKLAFGSIGCTADDQCVNYCEIDEGECY